MSYLLHYYPIMNATNTSIVWQPGPPKKLTASTQLLMKTRGLLTMALTAKCGATLNVDILFEGLALALEDEQKTLNTDDEIEGWVRSVILTCRGKAVLYARSFIPLKEMTSRSEFLNGNHAFSALKTLGDRPLGLWLTEHPQLTRTPFTFTNHIAGYWPHWPNVEPTKALPARQSILSLQEDRLILTEVFLIT